ncbi:MAG: hypothetical protein QXG10_02280 [Candidatus Hadarchaeales archaeon]
MNLSTKTYAALVLLVIGMFLLLEGSKLDRVGEEIICIGMMGAGAVLVIGYVYLIKGGLKRGISSYVIMMPVLFVLGIMLVYQAVVRVIDPISRALFGSLGAVLALASAFIIYRRRGKN